MKIDIQTILRVIELSGYDERMKPGQVFVWVNPTRAFLDVRARLMADLAIKDIKAETSAENVELTTAKYSVFNSGMMAWYAELWSQSADVESHWTAEEIEQLSAVDPSFFNWLVRESAQVMREHRTGEKKN